MPAFLKNWKTSLAGLVPFLVGGINLVDELARVIAASPAAPVSWHNVAINVALVVGAIGHFLAPDANKQLPAGPKA